jgi:hypothetical protein
MQAEFQKRMQVGLGEAILRVNLLHAKIIRGVANEDESKEHDLLMEALNEIKIDLGFDCNEDGVPDSIEIFAATAQTSCCRLVPFDTSRKKKPPSPRKSRKPVEKKVTKKVVKSTRGRNRR